MCLSFMVVGGVLASFEVTQTTQFVSYVRLQAHWRSVGQPACDDVDIAGSGSSLVGVRINSPDKQLLDAGAGVFVGLTTNLDDEYQRIYAIQTVGINPSVVICKAGASQSVSGGAFYIYIRRATHSAWQAELTDSNGTPYLFDCPTGDNGAPKAISHTDWCAATMGTGGGGGGDGEGWTCPTTATCNDPPSQGYDCATFQSSGTCLEPGTACPTGHLCTSSSTHRCAYAYAAKAAGSQCRAAAGPCDVAEVCQGGATDIECPFDSYASASTVCRVADGVCDAPETCTGAGPDCPADDFKPAGVECRAKAGICDVSETCTGSSAYCPQDAFAAPTTLCRPQDNRPGSCDVAEFCTGSAPACPADFGHSSGIVFKCGLDHFLTGGIDLSDLFAGNARNSLYLAGNDACNVGATKGAVTEGNFATAAGCAPARCPNGKDLSNAAFAQCQWSPAAAGWMWACTGKKENGPVALSLCPS